MVGGVLKVQGLCEDACGGRLPGAEVGGGGGERFRRHELGLSVQQEEVSGERERRGWGGEHAVRFKRKVVSIQSCAGTCEGLTHEAVLLPHRARSRDLGRQQGRMRV